MFSEGEYYAVGVSHRVGCVERRGCPASPPPHQPSPDGSASATPPQGGSDWAWERGRPARILFHWFPLSFRATLQAAATLAGTATSRSKESRGAVAGRSRWRRWPRLCQALCGRDARAPRKPSSTQKTGNMVYIMPGNQARRLMQASSITPPLRGSRRDKGVARSRAGGGRTYAW